MSNMPCSRTLARHSSADHLALLYGDFRRDKGVVSRIETFEAQSLQHTCLRPVGSMTLCLTFGINPASPRLSFRWLACLAGAGFPPAGIRDLARTHCPLILTLCCEFPLASSVCTHVGSGFTERPAPRVVAAIRVATVRVETRRWRFEVDGLEAKALREVAPIAKPPPSSGSFPRYRGPA